MNIDKLIYEVLNESNKKKKDDRCVRLAKQKYDTWPSAYASGAVVKCRQGKIWKEEVESLDEATKTDYSKEKKSGLHGWFSRQGGKGKSQGWVDCNTCRTDSNGKKTCKSCGRSEGEDRSKYPACRPTPSACGTKGKGKKWGKKTMKLEGKVNVSEILKYHIDNEISLSENVFRIYSEGFFKLINEVRSLYNKNLIRLNEEDTWLVESDLGKKVILEGGEEVYLDAPMYEEENEDERQIREELKLSDDHRIKLIKKMGSMRYFSITYNDVTKLFLLGKILDILYSKKDFFNPTFKVVGVPHFKRFLDLDFDYFIFMIRNEPYYFEKNLEKVDTESKDSFGRPSFLFDSAPISKIDDSIFTEIETDDSINEALHRGKNVKLGSPFRTPGGPKKFAVYVKTGKGTVKKVTFGDPNLRVKNNNKGAAKSFRARHKCDQKKDRTTAGYWSCNVGRYSKKLGLKSSRNW